MAAPLFAGPAGARGPGPGPNEYEARGALQEALRALDDARGAILTALQQGTIDTCGVYIQRAGTQVGYARNNLLRASACLRTPEAMRPFVNFRRIPASEAVRRV
jgi:hypothetical protein